MIRFAFTLAMIVAVVVPAAAESIVTGRDGKVIRLKDDGSWAYVLDAAGNPLRRPGPLGSTEASAVRRIDQAHAPEALQEVAPAGTVGLRIVSLDGVREGACAVTIAAFNNTGARFVRFYPEMVVVDRDNATLGHLEPKFQELLTGRARYLELPVHAVRCDRIAAARVQDVYACHASGKAQEVSCGSGQRVHASPDGVVPVLN